MDTTRKTIIGLLAALAFLLLVIVVMGLVWWGRGTMWGHSMRYGECPPGTPAWKCPSEQRRMRGMMGTGIDEGTMMSPGGMMGEGVPGMMGSGDMMAGGMQGMMGGGMMSRMRADAAVMDAAEGRIYVLAGDTLHSMNAQDYRDRRSVQVPSQERWRQTSLADALMQAYDRDGDGVITSDEAPQDSPVWRFDTDGSGRVTRDDLLREPHGMMMPRGMMMGRMGMTGGASIVVRDGYVHVFRAGAMYRFDAQTMELLDTGTLPPLEPTDAEGEAMHHP